MIRNLKILIAAAMAVTALGAIGASGVQAAEFHCSVTPCVLTPGADGTAKNSHHVFVVVQGPNSAATTCNAITGNATYEGKTTNEITFKEVSYDGCNVAGEPSTVAMNGCDYLFTSNGEVHLKCPEGKKIEIIVTANGCIFTIGEQTLKGVSYKTSGVAPNREVTLSTAVFNIATTVNEKCGFIKFTAGAATGEYTTGNTLVKPETEGGGAAEAWFE
jgi:hypothetical protein